MKYFRSNRNRPTIYTVAFILIGVIALLNQRLTIKDPENTFPKRIKRELRLLFNPAETKLEEHLIGKGISCEDSARLYQIVASATVVIQTDNSVGAGVFIGPRLIATANHVVDGKDVRVLLPVVQQDDLARLGPPIEVDTVYRVRGLDLAFVTTRHSNNAWLELERNLERDDSLMIVGHPKGRYYSLQKARIKKKAMLEASNFVVFKDNEIFFGNSGGAIVSCSGQLVGVVSMMSNFENTMLKRGIGINAKAIDRYARDLGVLG